MSKSAKGIIGLVVLFVLLGAGFWAWPKDRTQKQEIAGATAKKDPNHPQDVYYGKSQFSTLDSMIKDLRIKIYPEDKIDTFPPPELNLGSRIIVTRATPVEITDAKVAKIYRTWKQTVKELLVENKIELLGQDTVSPDLNEKLIYDMKIAITRVAELDVTEKEEINYRTIKKNSVDLEKGQTETEQRGKKGEKEVVYHIKRVDGVETERERIDSKVLTEPVNEIIIIGIGPKYVHSGVYADTLNAAAKKYLINATALQCLMLRESGGSADAGYPDAQYKGLFQYEEGYWADASARAGYGGASIYSAEAQIFTTAHEIVNGQSRRWPPYAYCANK